MTKSKSQNRKFEVIPAIDLKNGQCVRLRQGKEDSVTTYSNDPVLVAKQWVAEGAKWLHVVDLDGAFKGCPVNFEIIKRIINATSASVEVGGGIRTNENIDRMLEIGAKRVVIGTRALANSDELRKMASKYGDCLAVGIDASNGLASIDGWRVSTNVTAVDLARRVSSAGIRRIIYTETSRDGMLMGMNIEAVTSICEVVECNVIASGGVASINDIKRLLELPFENLEGVIVGKALYEGKVTLQDMLKLLERMKS